MLIIPAVDIKSGKCVRLTMGDYSKEKVYSDNPVEVAVNWEKKGAKFLHVVDLDGAKEGKLVNFEIVKEITRSIKIPIELGGGIRDVKTAEHVINNGVTRIVIGTAALDNDLLRKMVGHFGERVYVAIDYKDMKVSVEGWMASTPYTHYEFAEIVQESGVTGIIITDINRDGMLDGSDKVGFRDIGDYFKNRIIVSGGISIEEDVKYIKNLPLNIEGVIIGKALYENKLQLENLINENGEYIK